MIKIGNIKIDDIDKLTDEERKKLILEIDDRIEDLRYHQSAWGHAGGVGGRMAMDAHQEIKDLEMLKSDLENGTHNYEIQEIERNIKRLKALRDDAIFFKKGKFKKEIAEKEQELETLKTR